MTTNFAGWEQISEKLDRLFNQYGITEDIPDNADIAEFFKTAKFNTIYRARPNRGILNTCIPNTSYSFYIREANNIVGYDTQGNLYIGRFVNLSFIGWRQIAMSDEHHIKTYTTLEQLNLSDDEMVEDDFVGNLAKINNALTGWGVRMQLIANEGEQHNLFRSVLKQLKDEGIGDYTPYYSSGLGTDMIIERCAGAYGQLKVELLLDAKVVENGISGRERTIIAYANRDGSNLKFYSFKEVATTKQITVEPLNGWENYNGAAIVTKSGRYVNVDFDIRKGLTDRGTILFALPEGFRPPKDIAMMVIGEGGGATMRTVVNARGEIKLYDATAETVSIIGKGGFPI